MDLQPETYQKQETDGIIQKKICKESSCLRGCELPWHTWKIHKTLKKVVPGEALPTEPIGSEAQRYARRLLDSPNSIHGKLIQIFFKKGIVLQTVAFTQG